MFATYRVASQETRSYRLLSSGTMNCVWIGIGRSSAEVELKTCIKLGSIKWYIVSIEDEVSDDVTELRGTSWQEHSNVSIGEGILPNFFSVASFVFF